MTDQDKEHTRIFFAGLAMVGLISRGSVWEFKEAWDIADGMIETKDKGEELGIAAVKPRRRYNRKGA